MAGRIGRASKLTDKQWAEMHEEILRGARHCDMARKYKVSPANISARFSKRTEIIKDVANQIVKSETALRSLEIQERGIAISLADQMMAISTNLVGAASIGSATAQRLAAMAAHQVGLINPENPMEDPDLLKGAAACTNLANESAKTGLELLKINRTIPADQPINNPQQKPLFDDERLKKLSAEEIKLLMALAAKVNG